MNKRLIPINIKTEIGPIFLNNSSFLKDKEEINCFYSFIDIRESLFKFKVFSDHKKYSGYNFEDVVVIEYFPTTVHIMRKKNLRINRNELGKYFHQWVKRINVINDHHLKYDHGFQDLYSKDEQFQIKDLFETKVKEIIEQIPDTNPEKEIVEEQRKYIVDNIDKISRSEAVIRSSIIYSKLKGVSNKLAESYIYALAADKIGETIGYMIQVGAEYVMNMQQVIVT